MNVSASALDFHVLKVLDGERDRHTHTQRERERERERECVSVCLFVRTIRRTTTMIRTIRRMSTTATIIGRKEPLIETSFDAWKNCNIYNIPCDFRVFSMFFTRIIYRKETSIVS